MSFDIYPLLTADVVAQKMAPKILPKRRPRPPSPKCPWAERGINNPAEALPAHENDENEYFVTARSVFFH